MLQRLFSRSAPEERVSDAVDRQSVKDEQDVLRERSAAILDRLEAKKTQIRLAQARDAEAARQQADEAAANEMDETAPILVAGEEDTVLDERSDVTAGSVSEADSFQEAEPTELSDPIASHDAEEDQEHEERAGQTDHQPDFEEGQTPAAQLFETDDESEEARHPEHAGTELETDARSEDRDYVSDVPETAYAAEPQQRETAGDMPMAAASETDDLAEEARHPEHADAEPDVQARSEDRDYFSDEPETAYAAEPQPRETAGEMPMTAAPETGEGGNPAEEEELSRAAEEAKARIAARLQQMREDANKPE